MADKSAHSIRILWHGWPINRPARFDCGMVWPINRSRDYQPLKDKNLCLSILGLRHKSGNWISWFSALKIVYIRLLSTVDRDIASIQLQLKSDAIIFGTAQHTRSLPNLPTVSVAGVIVSISDHIKLLGVTLDSRLTFDTYISPLSKSCSFHIRALRHIHPALTTDSVKSIACSLIGCRLDYAGRLLWQKYEAPPAYPEHVGSSGYLPMRPHYHL